ncbi:MAG: helix-turn-helix domain-containing protein [Bacteroidia bacterium]
MSLDDKLNSVIDKLDTLISLQVSQVSDKYLTVSEAAVFLGVSYVKMRDMIGENKFPYSYDNSLKRKHIRIKQSDLQSYLDSLQHT